LRKRETQLRSVDAAAAVPAQMRTADDEVEDRIDAAQRSMLIARHLNALPTEFRETLVLREIEDLSYREIADVLQVPIGTVMSRLARGRAQLQRSLDSALAQTPVQEQTHGL
jgi:RNA polymerase sigma-70 factor (ECF subfamily)